MKINDTVYHVSGIMEKPQKGKIIKIESYNPNLIDREMITIELKNGKTITDYKTTFSVEYPAICSYWK